MRARCKPHKMLIRRIAPKEEQLSLKDPYLKDEPKEVWGLGSSESLIPSVK
jgi:hypothetical protein